MQVEAAVLVRLQWGAPAARRCEAHRGIGLRDPRRLAPVVRSLHDDYVART